MTQYQQIADQLRARLADLNGHVDQIESDLRQPQDQDSSERAIDMEDDEVLEGIEHANLDEIAQIEAALNRIAEGSYGTCTACGEPIAPARLQAMPAATRCIACA